MTFFTGGNGDYGFSLELIWMMSLAPYNRRNGFGSGCGSFNILITMCNCV